jgi:hypothetical protein
LDNPSIIMSLLSTRQLVLVVVLTALCVAIQLTPRPPNIEFTSLIIFLVGAVFGMSFGATLGVLVMFINGFLSPWGFSGMILPFQIIGMVIVGIGGGMYQRSNTGPYKAGSCAETAILGAFLTLTYDLITNFGIAVSLALTGTPILLAFLNAVIFGALFSVIHIVSNTAVFGIAFVPLTNTLQRILGGAKTWKKDSIFT